MYRTIILLIAIALSASGCVAPVMPQKTSLELQSIQAKEFETKKGIAFASVVSVFQDLGYIIATADLSTGLITAKSPTRDAGLGWFGREMQDTKATAFVEEIRAGHTKVRLNFVQSQETSSGYGQKRISEMPIEDAQVYQNAFAKIQEAIFIRSGTE